MRGDANQNSSFDISDGIAITNYLFLGSALTCLDAADINDDGAITLEDANAVQGFLFLGTHERPNTPYPKAGSDPTADSLNCSRVATTLPLPAPTLARIPTPVVSPTPGAIPTATPAPNTPPAPAVTPAPLPTPVATPVPPVVAAPKPTVSLATQRVMSANFVDSDYDGLSDVLEKTIGTKVNNPDSDGDGFRDGAETLSGFSPVISGNRKIAKGPYGLPRLTARQQAAVWRDLRPAIQDLNKGKLPPALRNAKNIERAVYAYLDGAPVKAVSDTFRLGAPVAPAFHPTISFAAWQHSPQYQRYLAVQGDPAGAGGALPTLQFRRGDANTDGQVDLSDVVRISMKFTSNQGFACDDAADANDDGRLDISDMIFLSSWYSQSTKEPPAPGPYTMGPDPTADSLGCASYPNQPAAPTVTAALAADTPAAGTVFGGQQRAPFTMFTLASSTADVVVESITVEQIGVTTSTDEIFATVELFDTNTSSPVLPAVLSLNAEHRAVFNTPFVVNVRTVRKLMISATLRPEASAHVGREVALAVVAIKLRGDTRLIAQLPIIGNRQTIGRTASPASVVVRPALVTEPSQRLAGSRDVTVSGLQLTTASTVRLQEITFTQHGTALGRTDFANPKLVDDRTGIVLATAVASSSASSTDPLHFRGLNYTLVKDQDLVLRLKVDLNAEQSQPNRTISLDIHGAGDIALVVGDGVTTTPRYLDAAGNVVTTPPHYNAPDTTIITSAGHLNVDLLDTPVSQRVVAGTQDFHAATVRLDTSGSRSDVSIQELTVFVHATDTPPTVYDNIDLYDGDQRVNAVDRRTVCSGSVCRHRFVFSPAPSITQGAVKAWRIVGDVATSDATGSFYLGASEVSAVDAQGAAVGVTYWGRRYSNPMTLTSTGALTIAALTQNHPAGLLPANTNGIEVGVLRFSAVQETVRVEKIYLSADSTRRVETHYGRRASAFNQVRAIHLYDGSTLVATVQPTSTDRLDRASVLIDVTANPIVVANTTIKDITVKVDTAPVTRYPGASMGDPGQGFVFSIAEGSDVLARGIQSAKRLDPGDIALSGAALNAYAVYATVPMVTVHNDLPRDERVNGGTLPRLTAGTQKELYRFRVAADSAGDVYLQQVTFMIDQQKATMTNPFIVRGDTGAQVAATSTSPLALINRPSRRQQNYAFWFTNDGLAPRPTTIAPERIVAGASRLYTLKGDVACWQDNGCGSTNGFGVIEVSFLGDRAHPEGNIANAPAYPNSAMQLYNPGANVNRLVWSDASIMGPLGIASGTATTSEQWTNGFRVSSAVSPIGRLQATNTDMTLIYP